MIKERLIRILPDSGGDFLFAAFIMSLLYVIMSFFTGFMTSDNHAQHIYASAMNDGTTSMCIDFEYAPTKCHSYLGTNIISHIDSLKTLYDVDQDG